MTDKKLHTFLLFLCFTAFLSAQTYKEWLDRSFMAADGKDWATAIDCVHHALQIEPGNPQNGWLLSNMGTYQRNLGQKQEALQTYTNGLLFAPNSVTLLLNRAALLLEMDSLKSAMQDYDRVTLLDQKCVEAWVSRGEISLAMNDTTLSRKYFEEALNLDSRNVRALSGKALLNKIAGRFTESEKIYNLLISQLADSQSLLFNRAELYFLNQKYTKALSDVNKAIKLSENDALSYFLRGKIHYSLFEQELAHQDFLKAKSLGYRSEELAAWLKKTR